MSADDTELPISEYFDIWKGMRGYATKFVDNLDLGTYLEKINLDGSKMPRRARSKMPIVVGVVGLSRPVS